MSCQFCHGKMLPMSDLGRNIRTLREAAGHSREVLAVKAGISASTLLRAELGHHQPTLTSLTRIAEALGTTVRDLFDEPNGAAA